MNDINRLLDKYFAGETSRDEEMQLRLYFSVSDVDDDLKELKPLFSFLDEETSVFEFLQELRNESKDSAINKLKDNIKSKGVVENNAPGHKQNIFLLPKVLKVATVAACLLFGVFIFSQYFNVNSEISQNIVWVDGEKINDINVVRVHAETSFSKVKTDDNIIEDQLNMMLK